MANSGLLNGLEHLIGYPNLNAESSEGDSSSKSSVFILNRGKDPNTEDFIREVMLLAFFEHANLQIQYTSNCFYKEGEMGFATVLMMDDDYQVFSHKSEGILIIDRIGDFYYTIISSNEPFNPVGNMAFNFAKADNEYFANNPDDAFACGCSLPDRYPKFKSLTYLVGARRSFPLPFLVEDNSSFQAFLDGENYSLVDKLSLLVPDAFVQYSISSPHYSSFCSARNIRNSEIIPNYELPLPLRNMNVTGINGIIDNSH
ncbi:MAG: hypothetical protein ACMXYG_00270 [Candidatus Woesearchaeota archaeon]